MENSIDFNSPEALELIHNLHAFSWELFHRLFKTEVNEGGKSFTDYVHDALEKHLTGKDNFNPEKSPLEYHLKYHIIRQAMYNDLPTHVKKIRKDLRAPLQESNLSNKPVKIPEPSSTPLISAVVGYDEPLILGEIEKTIKGDDIVERIYLAVCEDSFELSDRREICQKYAISENQFDNGRRRLRTAVENVLKNLGENKKDYL
jgi:hypothetical protein